MKKSLLLLTALFILTLVSFSTIVRAQAPGPSDATKPAPTAVTDVSKIYCAGSTITLTGPLDPSTGAPFTKYHWYKLAADQTTKTEVTTQPGQTYTEVSTTTAGYYYYELVTENANGCLSPISSLLQVYVLPPLTVSLNTPLPFCADGTTTTVLTATVPSPASGYGLTYVWTQTIGSTTTVVGTNSNTYTVPAQNTAGTPTYKVSVTYNLENGCPATASRTITVNALPARPNITAN